MFQERLQSEPFCWVEYKVLYLPLLNKYLGENFFKRGDCYYIKDGGYISRLVNGHGLPNIDANELVSEITVWFCEALRDYTFEEVITVNFDVERDAELEIPTYFTVAISTLNTENLWRFCCQALKHRGNFKSVKGNLDDKT